MIQVVHSIYSRNLGDMMCSPGRYFDDWSKSPEVDPLDYNGGDAIVGGGGWLPAYDRVIEIASSRRCAVWSMGINHRTRFDVSYSPLLKGVGLVGCRDYNSPFEYLPCVSCMCPEFDEIRKRDPVHPVVIYEHYQIPPIHFDPSVPVGCNHTALKMADVLRFMASGEVIATNSYHGMYWGFLLGRRVALWNVSNHKFFTLKHPAPNVSKWNDVFSRAAKAPDDYLPECRYLNVSFAARVRDMLS